MNKIAGRIFTNENCTGCNRCITACTVPEANIALLENEKNKIHVDAAKCINCAMCIKACPHDARDYYDDTQEFMNQLQQGDEISLLVAPAVRSNFPDYEKLLGMFRSLGVKNIYDTSFGADICTWAYLEYITKNNASGIISQPCPAIVNYIEKHEPDLIPMLAPVHSPAMCGAIYMKKYRKIPGKYAFLSPCIAKKDEFSDENTGNLVQYNVTYQKLMNELKRRNIDYRTYNPSGFDNDKHELGCLYPMPGGLKVNVLKNVPDAWVYQVEGQPEVKHFLNGYAKTQAEKRPLLVDILNCQYGCNMGTGALCQDEDGMQVSRAMYNAERDCAEEPSGNKKRRKNKKTDIQQKDDLNLDDFIRHYNKNKKVDTIIITPLDVEHAYKALLKETKAERNIDCCSCGFTTCEEMAHAIAKDINHPGNCVEYHKSVLRNRQSEISDMLENQNRMSAVLSENVEQIINAISQSSDQTDETANQVERINGEISGVQEVAEKISSTVEMLKDQIKEYVKLGSQIVNISLQTKLLSMNASIEASHAGDLGKGFAVVSTEMKRLSDQSAESANRILSSNNNILPALDEAANFSDSLNDRTKTISNNTRNILKAVQEISKSEQEIVETARRLQQEQD